MSGLDTSHRLALAAALGWAGPAASGCTRMCLAATRPAGPPRPACWAARWRWLWWVVVVLMVVVVVVTVLLLRFLKALVQSLRRRLGGGGVNGVNGVNGESGVQTESQSAPHVP